MRGPVERQAVLLSYRSIEVRVPADHPLRAMRRMVVRILIALLPRFQPLYSLMGRPSNPPERLLRGLLVEALLQRLLDDELTELLGRPKSARRGVVDAPAGARNGHGKLRRLAFMNGTVTVQRPRVRDVEARFVRRRLTLFQRQTPDVRARLPGRYLHGLILGAIATIYRASAKQRCWNHTLRHMLDAVPEKRQVEVETQLHAIASAETGHRAITLRDTVTRMYHRVLPRAVAASSGTGSGWSRTTPSRRSTGHSCARPT